MCQQRVKKVAMRRDCEKEHEGDEMIPRAGRRGVIETVAHLGAWRAGRWRSNRPPRPRGRCRTASSACRRPSRRGASFVNYIQSADLTGNKTPDERRARRSDDRAPVPARCLRRARASLFRPVRRPGFASRELARPVRPAGAIVQSSWVCHFFPGVSAAERRLGCNNQRESRRIAWTRHRDGK